MFRVAVVAAALFLSGCSTGTSRVGDQLASTSGLALDKKAIALIKLGAADPQCSVLTAGIGVREGDIYKLVQTARIVLKSEEPAVAEVALDAGEYHIVSYTCLGPKSGPVQLGDLVAGSNSRFKKSIATFELMPGEIVNVGFLRLVPLGATRAVSSRVAHVGVEATDWPMEELERFKQRRPALHAHMKTRLLTVTKVAPQTAEQIKAQCAEMKKARAAGKLKDLPPTCTAPAARSPKPIAKGEVKA